MKTSRGSISAFVVCLAATFALLSGLAFDGGRVVNTYVRVSDAAENAARLGAQNLVGIRSGAPRIDVHRATVYMDDFLREMSLSGRYVFSDRSITIEVSQPLKMTTLRMVGITSRRITVRRKVTILDG